MKALYGCNLGCSHSRAELRRASRRLNASHRKMYAVTASSVSGLLRPEVNPRLRTLIRTVKTFILYYLSVSLILFSITSNI